MGKEHRWISLDSKVDNYTQEGALSAVIRAVTQVMIAVFVYKILDLDIVWQVVGVMFSVLLVTMVNTSKVNRNGIYGLYEYIKVGDKYLGVEEMSKGWFEDNNMYRLVSLGVSYYIAGIGMYGFMEHMQKGVSSIEEIFGLAFYISLLVVGVREAMKTHPELYEWYFKNMEFLLAQYIVNKEYEVKIQEGEVGIHEANRFTDAFLTWYIIEYIMELKEGEWNSENEWSEEDEEGFKSLKSKLIKTFEGKVRFYRKEDIKDIEGIEDEESFEELKVKYIWRNNGELAGKEY